MTHTINPVEPIPGIGVGAIIIYYDNILLIKRDKPPALGQWSIPGGKLEPGESIRDACQREIQEETGLLIEVGDIAAVVERRVESFHYVIIDFIGFLTQESSRTPIANSDVSEARWVKMNQLQHYQLVDGLERIISKVHAALQQEKVIGLSDADGLGQDFI